MQFQIIVLCCLSILAISCGTASYDKAELYSALPSPEEKQYNDAPSAISIREIEQLRAQIKPPIRIAVAEPYNSAWKADESKIIESWLPLLQNANLAKEIVLIPRSMMSNGYTYSDYLKFARTAGAQLQADAVLVFSEAAHIQKYLNFFSIFDYVLVGLWVAPGHHRDAYIVVDAMLVDVANGYVYGTARGECETKEMKPYMYCDDGDTIREAHVEAVRQLGTKLENEAKRIVANVQSQK